MSQYTTFTVHLTRDDKERVSSVNERSVDGPLVIQLSSILIIIGVSIYNFMLHLT